MTPTDDVVELNSLSNLVLRECKFKPDDSRYTFKLVVRWWPRNLRLNAIKVFLAYAEQHRGTAVVPPQMLIRIPPVQLPVRKSPRAIVQVVSGEVFWKEHLLTRQRVAEYASQCNADYIVLQGDEFPLWPMANKFRIYDVLKLYERTLYLDLDIIIKPDAPNIFQQTPANKVCVYNEYLDTVAHGDQLRQHQRDHITKSQKLEPQEVRKKVVNGGVLLIPKEYAEVFAPPKFPIPTTHVADQTYLSARLVELNTPVHWLDRAWNCESVASDFWNQIPDSHFVHLNGTRPHEYRFELLERMKAGNFGLLQATPKHPNFDPELVRKRIHDLTR